MADTAVLIWSADHAGSLGPEDLSGGGHHGVMHGVTRVLASEALGQPSSFRFSGSGSGIITDDAARLNADEISLALWFRPLSGTLGVQKPLVVKAAPSHAPPWYQYGLFLLDRPGMPASIAFGVTIAGRFHQVTAVHAFRYDVWNHVVAVRRRSALVLYVNGKECASLPVPSASGACFATPVTFGSYATLPRTPPHCFAGEMSDLRLYATALDAPAVAQLFASLCGRFAVEPGILPGVEGSGDDPLTRALGSSRDVWGEAILAQGEASYESVVSLLPPLYYSTGRTNRQIGPHSLLFAMDGGEPPYIVPLADGSRVYARSTAGSVWAQVEVGSGEIFGSSVERREEPRLEDGYRLALQTRYTGADGACYAQECTAGFIEGIPHPLVLMRIWLVDAAGGSGASGRIRVRLAGLLPSQVVVSGGGRREEAGWSWELGLDRVAACIMWSPGVPLPEGAALTDESYERAKARWLAYWDEVLAASVSLEVPEERVLNVVRNLLMQNLMLRWRYSLGAAVYHGSFYQPESSDSVTVLGMYGFVDAFRDGLQDLLHMSKGAGQYTNWEIGEKLSHGAAYYHLTGDASFIRRNTPVYLEMIHRLAEQQGHDPHGLLSPQRICGDQAYEAYAPFHLMTCWRGVRDLRVIWEELGDRRAVEACTPLDASLKPALSRAVDHSSRSLDDGALFVPNRLLAGVAPFDPITATRDGSYWNLCMPYAFSSGFWDPGGTDLGRILQYFHAHGGVFLGMLRFNYYPLPVGSSRAAGLPGYATTGVDNVYLPGYIRMLSERDAVERLILSFYGQLAHGMTRGTFIAGEGDTLVLHPGCDGRSSYGSVCSANNAGKLLTLRLMLLRETTDPDRGTPQDLILAPATPRAWLADGGTIAMRAAPTTFGPVSFRLHSVLAQNQIHFSVSPPTRRMPRNLMLRVRVPETHCITGASVGGQPFERLDPLAATLNLSGIREPVQGILQVLPRD